MAGDDGAAAGAIQPCLDQRMRAGTGAVRARVASRSACRRVRVLAPSVLRSQAPGSRRVFRVCVGGGSIGQSPRAGGRTSAPLRPSWTKVSGAQDQAGLSHRFARSACRPRFMESESSETGERRYPTARLPNPSVTNPLKGRGRRQALDARGRRQALKGRGCGQAMADAGACALQMLCCLRVGQCSAVAALVSPVPYGIAGSVEDRERRTT